MLYGYGILAYFYFIKWLFWIFVVLSLLHLPAIVIFSLSEGIEDTKFGFYSYMSLGSMVSSTPVCFSAPVRNNHINLMCPEKSLMLGYVVSIGLIGN